MSERLTEGSVTVGFDRWTELLRDKKRLDWLQENADGCIDFYKPAAQEETSLHWGDMYPPREEDAHSLREAIDNARSDQE